MRILLVEGNERCRKVLGTELQKFAVVDALPDVESGLAVYCEQRPYDLLIVDYSQEGLLEGVHRLGDNPKAILYVKAAGVCEITTDDLKRLNVVDVWPKPFSLRDLKDRITRSISDGAYAYYRAFAA